MYPKPIENLIRSLTRLPSVGRRTAERYVFHLLKSGKKEVAELTLALKQLAETMKSCAVCRDFSDVSPCRVCADRSRDHATIAVVAESQDVQALERTGAYAGVYHVLRGVIDPEEIERLDQLKVADLLDRARDQNTREIILALNPDIKGETTMMYLEAELKELRPDLTVTRLARGLPMGSDLEYADEITLGSALRHRLKQ
ncbi:MAG: Recombination protein RecR [Candidatus Magasanikbacteria bacterium GW2011_GWA2_56_11]|uniref:Recombination protein RecR n=1 Tax=Candidatus Magasanikbacteria bacterium GW2011_GWA2_56_11 TaxID=1619044 RepID=A0A0G2AKJ8_9BACT|nr:MAG: Recombination protein RecR [Candidatus Magasanikbacteria bacterium GW2011_GWA2_56_11]